MKRKLLALTTSGALVGLLLGYGWSLRERPETLETPSPKVPSAPRIAPVRDAPPVLFLGLDGADWQLLDRYMADGVMPNLTRFVAEGTGGVLNSVHPPLSPLVWTTMMTGVSPVEHGILDFTRFNPTSGQKEPITSSERRVPAIWNIATYAGRSVASFGLWATYPAEPVDGLMVSDRLFGFLYQEDAPPPGVVHPPSEEGWAREVLHRVEDETGIEEMRSFLPWLEASEYERLESAREADPYAHPVTALRRILVETEVYHRMATEWIGREAPDLAIVYLQGTDSIGHVFAPFAPPRQATVTEEEYRRYHRVPDQYFRLVDRLLGEYRDLAARTGAVLMLASDHGFYWEEGRPTELSSFAHATAGKWHRKEGLYLLWGPGIEAEPGHPHEGEAAQVCATLLSLSGLPPGFGLEGPVLPGSPAVEGEAVRYAEHYRPAEELAEGVGASEEAMEKLEALGYIGSGEIGAAPEAARGSSRTPGSYNNEGLVLRAEGRWAEAEAAFERALSLDPNLGSALWNLSEALFQQGKEPDRSDRLLVEAFGGGVPETRRFLLERTVVYHRRGQTDRSLQLLEAAVAARGDVPEAWLFLGRYHVEVGRCREAVAAFERAARLEEGNAATHASLGLAYLCLGDPAAAQRALRRSLELDPAQPKVREFLRTL